MVSVQRTVDGACIMIQRSKDRMEMLRIKENEREEIIRLLLRTPDLEPGLIVKGVR